MILVNILETKPRSHIVFYPILPYFLPSTILFLLLNISNIFQSLQHNFFFVWTSTLYTNVIITTLCSSALLQLSYTGTTIPLRCTIHKESSLCSSSLLFLEDRNSQTIMSNYVQAILGGKIVIYYISKWTIHLLAIIGLVQGPPNFSA